MAAYIVSQGLPLPDFLSGLVHWTFDTWGDPQWRLLGNGIVRGFREHHVDPRGITRHDFVETNGNNCIICIPTALTVYLYLPAREELWALFALSFTAWFMVGIFMTNQFHKWAHMDTPPAFVRWLQGWGVILSREHHDIHHESPYDTYYCITVGFWNPILDRTHFFERVERLIRRSVPGTDPRLRSEREESLDG